MAHTLNALKRLRQSTKRYDKNKAIKSAVKTQIKEVLAAIKAKDKDRTQNEFIKASSMLDKAAKLGALHKNNASRRKSRLAAQVNKSLAG